MPSIKAVETLAAMAVETGEKILPSRLHDVIETLSSKAGLNANRAAGQYEHLAGVNASEIRLSGELKTPELPGLNIELSPERAAVIKANQTLVSHISDLMPQVHDGKLDWILGGSSAVNALAGSRSLRILDSASLPSIVPTRTIELTDNAIASLQNFTRRVGDVDAFVVNNGQNRFLGSPYANSMDLAIPDAAAAALRRTGEYRYTPIIQPVKMEFAQPEVAAIEMAGKTVYLTGPGQLLANKFRHVLSSYAPADAEKLTGDFSHLFDAASSIYSEKELMQFGKQALQRNNLLYHGEVMVPWDASANNGKFVSFLRRVLESEERNGAYFKGLKIEPKDSIEAMRLLEKHPLPRDKAAMSDFINRHSELVKAMDTQGSPERALFLEQGGSGRASDTFMNMLQDLKAGGQVETSGLRARLRMLDERLSQSPNLPELSKLARHL